MKILIIRFSSIGDIVLTTPIIRCIKQQLKGVELHYLTKKAFSGIIETNPCIDKIHTIEKDIPEITTILKKENFDYIIDLHNNLRSLRTKLLLGKKAFSFPKLNKEKWLMVNFKMNRLPDAHIVDRYFRTVELLGIKNDQQGLDYFIPGKDLVTLASLPEIFQQSYTAFVIGARHFTKQLPVEKIISICKKIKGPVILLGGKEDVAKAEQIKSQLGEKVYNACGKYNLNQSASLIQQAGKVITHDTGLMHIAAAFNKEIISIWGNTIPEFGMYPYKPDPKSVMLEVKGLSCRPCSKIGYDACPKGHFRCMKDIDETVFENL